MKKLITLLLVISVLLSSGIFTVFGEKTSPHYFIEPSADSVTVNETTYTVVRTKQEFLGMSSGCYILGNDIDFGGEEFSSAPVTLTGDFTLDGNGYAVYGLSVNTDSNSSVFSTVGENFTVIDIIFGSEKEKITVSTTGAAAYAGVILGKVEQACNVTIENTDVYANVSSSGTNARISGFVGGCTVASDTAKWSIKNCRMYGSIIGNAGSASYAGGFAGELTSFDVSVTDCSNYATVEKCKFDAGIVGRYATKNASIKNCVNYGNISGTGTANLGAVSGILSYAAGTITISNCLNAGTLNGTDNSGGIIAAAYSFAITVENCANIGSVYVNTTNTQKYAAGIVGYLQSTVGKASYKLINCASFGSITTESGAVACILRGSLNNDVNVVSCIKECSGTHYIAQDGVTLNSTSEDEAVSAEAALEVLAPMFPSLNFELSGDSTVIVSGIPAERKYPILVGVQDTKPDEMLCTQSIRFVAALDSLEYTVAGFEVEVSYNDPDTNESKIGHKKLSTKYVFTDLLAIGDSGVITYTAQDFGSNYLLALVIDDVPTDAGTITFTVRAFADDSYDTAYVIQYENGAFVSCDVQ